METLLVGYLMIGVVGTLSNFYIMREAEGSWVLTWKEYAFQALIMLVAWPFISLACIRGNIQGFAA